MKFTITDTSDNSDILRGPVSENNAAFTCWMSKDAGKNYRDLDINESTEAIFSASGVAGQYRITRIE
jgi:hypothetical protein